MKHLPALLSHFSSELDKLAAVVEDSNALAAEERADLLADRDKWRDLAETLGARGQLNTGWGDRKQIHYSFIVDDILLVAGRNPEQIIFYMCQRAYAELVQHVKENYK